DPLFDFGLDDGQCKLGTECQRGDAQAIVVLGEPRKKLKSPTGRAICMADTGEIAAKRIRLMSGRLVAASDRPCREPVIQLLVVLPFPKEIESVGKAELLTVESRACDALRPLAQAREPVQPVMTDLGHSRLYLDAGITADAAKEDRKARGDILEPNGGIGKAWCDCAAAD